MAKAINSFALLDDEEGDDFTVLAEHVSKKIVVPASEPKPVKTKKQPAQTNNQSNNQIGSGKTEDKLPPSKFRNGSAIGVASDRGRGGRGRGSERLGFQGNHSENLNKEQGNGYRRNHRQGYGNEQGNGNNNVNYGQGYGNEQGKGYKASYGQAYNNRYDNGYRGRGGIRGRGRGKVFNKEASDETAVEKKEVSEGKNGKGVENADDGWVTVRRTRGLRNAMSNNGEVEEIVNVEDKNAAPVVEDVSDNVVAQENAAPVSEESTDVAEKKDPEESVDADRSSKKNAVKEIVNVDASTQNRNREFKRLLTLGEYEKNVAEKRQALEALKLKERKVTADKDFEAMELIANKKGEELEKHELVTKLKKDEKTRKTISIDEFLKPAHGRGRGRRDNGNFRGQGNKTRHDVNFRGQVKTRDDAPVSEGEAQVVKAKVAPEIEVHFGETDFPALGAAKF